MDSLLHQNKLTVQRFNQEVIAAGNVASFQELMDEHFVNHSAPAGTDNGPNGMWHTFNNILRPALSDLQVHIHAQVAEGDIVTTRKTITGTHTGPLLGIAPTGQPVTIEVMDMVRLRNGKYYEHWGLNTLTAVLAHLRQQ
jgi:predicted ester cyclase